MRGEERKPHSCGYYLFFFFPVSGATVERIVKVNMLVGSCRDLLVIPVVEVGEFVGGRFSLCSLV